MEDSTHPGARTFGTTRWSIVLAAGRGGSEALAALCVGYWYPLYAFARQFGHTPHDAEDLPQGFLADRLARGGLAGVARERGRFRTFLLASLKHFIADQRDRARSLKRGGGRATLSFDAFTAEERSALEPQDGELPDRLYDRQWALALVERALKRLEREYAAQAKLFEALRPMLMGQGARPYAETGANLGMEAGAVEVAVHRMRRRYGAALRSEVAETVHEPSEVEAELRHLLAVLDS